MRALTDQLAPPLPGATVGNSSRGSNPLNNPQFEAPPRPPPPQLNGDPPGYDAPPSYNEAQATMGAHGEVKKRIWEENGNNFCPQVMILGARENEGEQAWSQAMQGEVAEVLLTMEGVQVELFLARSHAIQSFGFLSHQSLRDVCSPVCRCSQLLLMEK